MEGVECQAQNAARQVLSNREVESVLFDHVWLHGHDMNPRDLRFTCYCRNNCLEEDCLITAASLTYLGALKKSVRQPCCIILRCAIGDQICVFSFSCSRIHDDEKQSEMRGRHLCDTLFHDWLCCAGEGAVDIALEGSNGR